MKWYDDFLKQHFIYFVFHLLCFFLFFWLCNHWVFHFLAKQESLKEQEEIKAKIEQEQSKVISFWYGTLDAAHVFIHSYFFDAKESSFNEKILNKALNCNMQYYRLLFVNFNNHSLDFQDYKDRVFFYLKDGKGCSNISLTGMLENAPKKYFLFLKSFLNFEKIPIGYAKSYLLAFPNSLEIKEIDKVELQMQGEKYPMKKQAALRKSWQEYLERPQENFWQKERE